MKRTINTLADRRVISLPPIEEIKIQLDRREDTVEVYRIAGEQGKTSADGSLNHQPKQSRRVAPVPRVF